MDPCKVHPPLGCGEFLYQGLLQLLSQRRSGKFDRYAPESPVEVRGNRGSLDPGPFSSTNKAAGTAQRPIGGPIAIPVSGPGCTITTPREKEIGRPEHGPVPVFRGWSFLAPLSINANARVGAGGGPWSGVAFEARPWLTGMARSYQRDGGAGAGPTSVFRGISKPAPLISGYGSELGLDGRYSSERASSTPPPR